MSTSHPASASAANSWASRSAIGRPELGSRPCPGPGTSQRSGSSRARSRLCRGKSRARRLKHTYQAGVGVCVPLALVTAALDVVDAQGEPAHCLDEVADPRGFRVLVGEVASDQVASLPGLVPGTRSCSGLTLVLIDHDVTDVVTDMTADAGRVLIAIFISASPSRSTPSCSRIEWILS